MFFKSNIGQAYLLLPAFPLVFSMVLPIAFISVLLFFTCSAKAEVVAVAIEKSSMQTIQLIAQPNSCITLYQGRACFTNITFNWQSTEQGDYCLHQNLSSGEHKILHCWQASQGAKKTVAFESTETSTFELKKQHSDKVLSETKVSVSWVHKATPRKRRWRLF
jgi:hypothetical protein